MELKYSNIGKSYWFGNGVYQKEYISFYEKYRLATENPNTIHGKLLKMYVMLIQEYYKHGNSNARVRVDLKDEHICSTCKGSGWLDKLSNRRCNICHGDGYAIDILDESLYSISPKFDYMLKYIDDNLDDIIEVTQAIRTQILGHNTTYSELESTKYTILGDKLIYHLIRTEDKNL